MKEKLKDRKVSSPIDYVELGGENFYKISNSDLLRPFFMSIVSDSNHWMFISSNGGLTAGRKNSEFALFPYYTDDKITESTEVTGTKSIFQVRKEGQTYLWEPFSERFDGMYQITRNLYKNVYGNKVLFEEVNHTLGLSFQYQWNSSNKFGFVKKAKLTNLGENKIDISILDGLQNILPFGVGSDLQNQRSNLVDAYKRSELDKDSGLGIFALSAIIVDRAEPSEALKANVVWSLGLNNAKHLLSSLQLSEFRSNKAIKEEHDIKAEKGAYFVNSSVVFNKNDFKEWWVIANVNQNHSDIAALISKIKSDDSLKEKIQNDIDLGTQRLVKLNAASDGFQVTADKFRDTRHFSNTLFNIMRGGIFDDNYNIEKWDFQMYIKKANKDVFLGSKEILKELPEVFSLSELKAIIEKSSDKDFKRLCSEYLPLKFSRRHGDPSRPWNKFSINTRSEIDGSKILDYEGNWRDIFQNWEALAHSYPQFMEGMIYKFLNATTFDGYNPYRVTKDGFDWEAIEEHDPWSYIGYWGDHQIIYLLKFLEFIEESQPGKLKSIFTSEEFVYANVPYKIKSYSDILTDPKDTIDFDYELDRKIRLDRENYGADAALLKDKNQEIYHVNFIEKILATVLAKMSNFIPEGGIWLNTQRPEWNDANNALVGNGVSMVTLYYLRRFLKFFEVLLESESDIKVDISSELVAFFESVHQTLNTHKSFIENGFSDKDRKTVLDGLGLAASVFRNNIYQNAFANNKKPLDIADIKSFISLALTYLEQSIDANKRTDNLYHAYNLMTINDGGDEVRISFLDQMLEGQVAVLSSGYLTPEKSLSVLDAQKSSKLFREDQYSYLLYPNKDLPGFLQRNNIPEASVRSSQLLQEMLADKNKSIISKDIEGKFHFHGDFNNAGSLKKALADLENTKYYDLAIKERAQLLKTFEEVFNHKAFTGRSGTFYGYEGLGSIYWHMVSKLQLAVQECCLKAFDENASPGIIGRLLEHYYEINEGIGVHKSPELYGAFPTDPYSHTPAGKGAQQPGMTGQVKEDILSRIGELGVFVRGGQLTFNPCLLRKNEFLTEENSYEYISVDGKEMSIPLSTGSLAFSYCQIPIVYNLSKEQKLLVNHSNERKTELKGLQLDKSTSSEIFSRSGQVKSIEVYLTEDLLR